MSDVFFKHNEKILRGNKPATALPAVPVDIQGLIGEYNQVETEQEQRLGAIWAYMRDRQIAGGFVAFGNSQRWTSNAWPKDNERPDLHMGGALAGLCAFITDANLGEP